MNQPIELVSPQSAATEKQIAAHVKVIRLGIEGHQRAGRLMFAYAAVAGAHAEALMAAAPHGEGEKILEHEFPDTGESTLKRWRAFARALQPALAKRPTVGLLTAPQLGKKSIPAKAAQAIQEAVLEVMDGKGMVEFLRASPMLKEPAPKGGDRGGGQAPRTPTPAEQVEAADAAMRMDRGAALSARDNEISRALCHVELLRETREAVADWLRALDATLKARRQA